MNRSQAGASRAAGTATRLAPGRRERTRNALVAAATDVFGNVQPAGSFSSFYTLDTVPPEIERLLSLQGDEVFVGQTAEIRADSPTRPTRTNTRRGGRPTANGWW